MKKQNIVKKNLEFNRIINTKKPYKYKNYIIYLEKNNSNNYKFGISVGTKIGNAVTRNKIKRQIRNIISKKDYQKGFNCIIIVGRGILNINYNQMEINLLEALNNLNIIKEIINEK